MKSFRQKPSLGNAPIPSQDTPWLVVAYDIGDNRKRNKMFKLLRGYGTAVQESLFLCRMNRAKQIVLSKELQGFPLDADDRLHSFRIGHDSVVLNRGGIKELTWIEE